MKRYLSVVALFASLVACTDPFEGDMFLTDDGDDTKITNIAYLEKHAEDYSLFLDFLKYADYYNALNDAGTTVTVFAPNNVAMQNFMEFKGITAFDQLDKTYARQIVQVHLLKTSLSETSFIQYVNEGAINVPTIFGDYLEITYGYEDNDVDDAELVNVTRKDSLNLYLNNMASVVEIAHQTVNGMVYQVGGVVRPLCEKVMEKMKDYGEYSLFLEAINATSWKEKLNISSDTTYQELGAYTVNAVNYTVFAVPDVAYKEKGITDLAGLKNELKKNPLYANAADTTVLYDYIAYHVMDGLYDKTSLTATADEGGMGIFDTYATNEVFTVKSYLGQAFINGDGSDNQMGYSFIRTNVKASNGIIHKIDGIMPVFRPEPVTVKWDLCSSSDIVSIVNAYGAANSLGNYYTAAPSKEKRIDLTTTNPYGAISNFTYYAATTKSSYNKVGYCKCAEDATGTYANADNAYQNDLFIVNLGYTGWVQFKTPTIIKGKYQVNLYYGGSKMVKKFYSTGSAVKFSIDSYNEEGKKLDGGYAKNLFLWKGWDQTEHTVKSDELFEVNFETSTSHIFRAVLQDVNASATANYHFRWDYVEFIPVQ